MLILTPRARKFESISSTHGRNEVSWCPSPRARSKFVAPMFEPEVFLKQVYCIEESTCDIVGTFRRPEQSFGAPIVIVSRGMGPPFPLVTPRVPKDPGGFLPSFSTRNPSLQKHANTKQLNKLQSYFNQCANPMSVKIPALGFSILKS